MYFLNQANEFYNVYFGEAMAESFNQPLVIFSSLVSFPEIAEAVRYTFWEIPFYTFPLKDQIYTEFNSLTRVKMEILQMRMSFYVVLTNLQIWHVYCALDPRQYRLLVLV